MADHQLTLQRELTREIALRAALEKELAAEKAHRADFEQRLQDQLAAQEQQLAAREADLTQHWSLEQQRLEQELAASEKDLQSKVEAIRELEERADKIKDAVQTRTGTVMSAKAAAAEMSHDESTEEQIEAFMGLTEEQIEAFMGMIERMWTKKNENLLHELCANLKQPCEQGGAAAEAEPLSFRVLAEVCEELQKQHDQKPLNASLQKHPLAMGSWVVYTMQDVDIDRLFQFGDCPILPQGMEEPAERDAFYKDYRDRCGSNRNPKMFEVANWATRVCYDTCGHVRSGGQEGLKKWVEEGVDSAEGLKKWVKWLCFLGASAKELEDPVTVTRGLCNLPQSLVDQHRSKMAGDILFWAAPSSTADDASISETYCNQRKPMERNVLFTISGVSRAFPMFELSHYPKEREWLLPPFCKLEVLRVVDVVPLQVYCRFAGCVLGDDLRERIMRDFQESSDALSKVDLEEERKQKDKEKLDIEEAVQRLRQEQSEKDAELCRRKEEVEQARAELERARRERLEREEDLKREKAKAEEEMQRKLEELRQKKEDSDLQHTQEFEQAMAVKKREVDAKDAQMNDCLTDLQAMLDEMLDQKATNYDELQWEVTRADYELAQLLTEREENRRKLATEKEEKERIGEKLERRHIAEKAQLHREIEVARRTHSGETRRSNCLIAEQKQLRLELERERAKHNEAERAAEANLREIKDRLETEKQEKEMLRSMREQDDGRGPEGHVLAQLEVERGQWAKRLGNLEEELKQKDKEQLDIEQAVQRLRHEQSEKDAELCRRKEEVEQARKELQRSKEELERARHERLEREESLMREKAEKAKAEEEVQELRRKREGSDRQRRQEFEEAIAVKKKEMAVKEKEVKTRLAGLQAMLDQKATSYGESQRQCREESERRSQRKGTSAKDCPKTAGLHRDHAALKGGPSTFQPGSRRASGTSDAPATASGANPSGPKPARGSAQPLAQEGGQPSRGPQPRQAGSQRASGTSETASGANLGSQKSARGPSQPSGQGGQPPAQRSGAPAARNPAPPRPTLLTQANPAARKNMIEKLHDGSADPNAEITVDEPHDEVNEVIFFQRPADSIRSSTASGMTE